MNEIVLAIVVVVILTLILTILFLFTIRRVNILVRKNFIDKLQEYDFLVEDKENKVEELNKIIENKREEEQYIITNIEKLQAKKELIEINEVDVVIPKGADYQDEKMFEKYRKIKGVFNFSYENKIQEFLENEIDDNEDLYYVYLGIKEYLTHKVVYKISTYSPADQKIIINELLREDIKKYVKDLINVKKFSIAKFVNELDTRIMQNDPKIYIHVSNVNLNFNHLDERIETIYDETLTEGFKIKYKGKIYDYSI
jgi:hypothetical protein